MRQGRLVEQVPPASPVRQQLIRQLGEAISVVAFDWVSHLVDDDVPETVWVLGGEFQIEPDLAGLWIERALLRLHSPDTPAKCRERPSLAPTPA